MCRCPRQINKQNKNHQLAKVTVTATSESIWTEVVLLSILRCTTDVVMSSCVLLTFSPTQHMVMTMKAYNAHVRLWYNNLTKYKWIMCSTVQCDPPSAPVPNVQCFIRVCSGGTDTSLCCKACSLFAAKQCSTFAKNLTWWFRGKNQFQKLIETLIFLFLSSFPVQMMHAAPLNSPKRGLKRCFCSFFSCSVAEIENFNSKPCSTFIFFNSPPSLSNSPNISPSLFSFGAVLVLHSACSLCELSCASISCSPGPRMCQGH